MVYALFSLAILATIAFLVVLLKKFNIRRVVAALLIALVLWGSYALYLRPTTPSLPESCVFQVWCNSGEEFWIEDAEHCAAIRELLSQTQIRHEYQRRGSYPADGSFIIRIYDARSYRNNLPEYAGELYVIPQDLARSRYYTNRAGRNGYLFLNPAQLLNQLQQEHSLAICFSQ